MDPVDYYVGKVIGPDNIEVDCTEWNNIEQISYQTLFFLYNDFNSYSETVFRTLYEYESDSELKAREFFNEYIDASYDLAIKSAIFYNSLRCVSNQETGSVVANNTNNFIFAGKADITSADVSFTQVPPFPQFPNGLATSNLTLNLPPTPGILIDFTGKTTFIEQYYTDYKEALTAFHTSIEKFITYVNGTRFPATRSITQPVDTSKCDMPVFEDVSINVGATSIDLSANLTSFGSFTNGSNPVIQDVGFIVSDSSGWMEAPGTQVISLGNSLGVINTSVATTENTTYHWTPYVFINYDDGTGGTVSYLHTPLPEKITTEPDALTIHFLQDNEPITFFTVDTTDDPQEFTVRWVPYDTNKATIENNYSFGQGTGVQLITETIYELGGTGGLANYYKMQIFGTSLTNIKFNGSIPGNIKFRNARILNWGNNPWKKLDEAFYDLGTILMAATDAPDLSQCTTLAKMFSICREVGKVFANDFDGNGVRLNGDWTGWDVSNIVDASRMFEFTRNFTADFGAWSWDSATDLSYFFSNTYISSGSDVGGNADFSQWQNIGAASELSLRGFFENAEYQTKPIFDLNNVVTNKIDVRSLLYNALRFNQDLSSWGPKISALVAYDPGTGVDLDRMLASVGTVGSLSQPTNFTTWDFSNVTKAQYLFYEYKFANSVVGLDNKTWNNTGIYQDWRSMFEVAINIPDINNWSFTNVGRFSSMFRLANFKNPAQDLSGWSMNTNNGVAGGFREFDRMFESVESTNSGQVPIVSAWTFNNPFSTLLDRMFYNNPNFNQDIGGWNIGNDVRMPEMFSGCSSFNCGDTPGVFGNKMLGWNVDLIQNNTFVFFDAISFNQNIEHWQWETQNTQGMFGTNNGAANKMTFDQDISGWGFGIGTNGFTNTQFLGFHVNADGANQFSTVNLDALLISIAKNILDSPTTSGKKNITFQVDGQPSCLPAATGGPYNTGADIIGVQDAITYLNGTLGWTIQTNACI
jgi:hypothetical protein